MGRKLTPWRSISHTTFKIFNVLKTSIPSSVFRYVAVVLPLAALPCAGTHVVSRCTGELSSRKTFSRKSDSSILNGRGHLFSTTLKFAVFNLVFPWYVFHHLQHSCISSIQAFFSLRSRRLEVAGERENGRARGRHARGKYESHVNNGGNKS